MWTRDVGGDRGVRYDVTTDADGRWRGAIGCVDRCGPGRGGAIRCEDWGADGRRRCDAMCGPVCAAGVARRRMGAIWRT